MLARADGHTSMEEAIMAGSASSFFSYTCQARLCGQVLGSVVLGLSRVSHIM